MEETATEFCLKWKHFHDNFTSQFGYLKDEQQFVDVTFSCENKLLRAHKVVLSASSPYLTQLFKDNPCKHAVIILDEVPYSHLESLLCFIYTGSVSIVETELPEFLESANVLQIRGLSDNVPMCEQVTSKRSSSSSLSVESNTRKRSSDGPPTQAAKKIINKCDIYKSVIKQELEIEPHVVDSPPESSSEASSNSSLLNQERVKFEPDADVDEILASTSELIVPVPPAPTAISDVDYIPDGRKRHSLDPRPCPKCNRLYSNLSNLRQHMRLIHNPTVVTCRLCRKTFKTDLYLRRHLISYHDLNLYIEQGGAATDGMEGVNPALLVTPPAQMNQHTLLMQ